MNVDGYTPFRKIGVIPLFLHQIDCQLYGMFVKRLRPLDETRLGGDVGEILTIFNKLICHRKGTLFQYT